MLKRKKRRRTSQVYPTEKPSLAVIIGCLVIGVGLLVYFFNPYTQVTSPLPPQSTALLSNSTLPNIPDVPRTLDKSLVPPDTTAPVVAETNAAPAPSPEK